MSTPILLVLVSALIFNTGAQAALHNYASVMKCLEKGLSESQLSALLKGPEGGGIIDPFESLFPLLKARATYSDSSSWNTAFTQAHSPEELVFINAGLDGAAKVDPFESVYPLLKTTTLMLHSENKAAALPFYQKAILLNPCNALFLRELAHYHVQQGTDKMIVEKLFRSAIRQGPLLRNTFKEYGLWLIRQNRRDEGYSMIRKAISLAPSMAMGDIVLMLENGLTLENMSRVLPDRVEAYMVCGNYLLKEGNTDLAERIYAKAIELVPNETKVKDAWFQKVSGFYQKQDQPEKALDVMLAAIQYLPKDVGIRLTTAFLYEKLQITSRAKEEYKNALMLDPRNETARRRLAQLNS